jgi:predicted nucleic acid-binding protein
LSGAGGVKGFAQMGKKKAATEGFVLDGSISLAWYFKDEANPYADAVAARFPGVQAVVPGIWPLEVANAVLMGERRKRSTEAQAARWLGSLSSLPITVDDETNIRAWSDVLNLARLHNLSAYDAAYLELALRRGVPLATLDDKLKAAAAAVGVAEYKP